MIESDPQTYREASEDPIWKTSMKEEFHSLQKNDTWELVILPSGRKLVKCKWVFKTKCVVDRSPLKYKASLVAKGFSQVKGIDCNETFALVAKMDSVTSPPLIPTMERLRPMHRCCQSGEIAP